MADPDTLDPGLCPTCGVRYVYCKPCRTLHCDCRPHFHPAPESAKVAETPRTDEIWNSDSPYAEERLVELSRQLERERNLLEAAAREQEGQIEQLERELAEAGRWIPVSEQAAPTAGLIDVWNGETRFTGCYWDHVCREHRCIQAGHLIRISKVTHWMPAPKPPGVRISEAWCRNMAEREDGGEIGAGPVARDPTQ
jgi:hypothetical protein